MTKLIATWNQPRGSNLLPMRRNTAGEEPRYRCPSE